MSRFGSDKRMDKRMSNKPHNYLKRHTTPPRNRSPLAYIIVLAGVVCLLWAWLCVPVGKASDAGYLKLSDGDGKFLTIGAMTLGPAVEYVIYKCDTCPPPPSVEAEPEPPAPWFTWLETKLDTDAYWVNLCIAIDDATDLVDEPDRADFAAAICATLWQESGCKHYSKSGKVKRGDGGRAIGAAQVHRSPWQKHYTEILERDIDLDYLHDNIEICARLLLRGGWGDAPNKEVFTYYNSGDRGWVNGYGRSVNALYEKIRSYEDE